MKVPPRRKYMNKIKTGMALGAAAMVGLAGFSIYDAMMRGPVDYEQPPVTARVDFPVSEPYIMTVDETFETLLPTLVSANPIIRQTGLDALNIAYRNGAGKELSGEMREETADALIELYDTEKADTPKSVKIKVGAIRMLVTLVGGPETDAFASDILHSQDTRMKVAALKILSENRIADADLRKAAYQASQEEDIPEWIKPRVYRRALGSKAEGEILALMSSTEEPQTIRNCAVELQNLHKPKLLGPVLSRLEEAGMLGDVKELPWFSGRLLSKHIEDADDDELLRALRVVWLRPSLTRTTMKAVQERLAHADPGIRRLVARIIPDAVKQEGLDFEIGEELLAAALQIETDPAVKGEIEGSLTAVRQTRRTTPKTENSGVAQE